MDKGDDTFTQCPVCGAPFSEPNSWQAAPPTPAPVEGEAVGWVSKEHLEFLANGRAINTPSSATVHDRPNEQMGWIQPLYTAEGANSLLQSRIAELKAERDLFEASKRSARGDASDLTAAILSAQRSNAELLELVQSLIHAWDDAYEPSIDYHYDLMERARAAISKQEGR